MNFFDGIFALLFGASLLTNPAETTAPLPIGSALRANAPAPAAETLDTIDEYDSYFITAGGAVYTLEQFVTGVVMAEVPYSFEPDALMAQAVAARTYCLYTMNLRKDYDTITSDDIYCAFASVADFTARWGGDYAKAAFEATSAAVKATEGILLTDGGQPILATWHASSRGTTEACANVWNGAIDYLVPVSTPEKAEDIKSDEKFTLTQVKNLLAKHGYTYNMKKSLRMTLNSSGRCETLTLGNVTLSGLEVRTLFGLRSTDFTVKFQSGQLTFKVYGYGHGVGLSQLGANALAQAGYDWRQILSHYYPGTALSGASEQSAPT